MEIMRELVMGCSGRRAATVQVLCGALVLILPAATVRAQPSSAAPVPPPANSVSPARPPGPVDPWMSPGAPPAAYPPGGYAPEPLGGPPGAYPPGYAQADGGMIQVDVKADSA